MSSKPLFCTICSYNYLAVASALIESFIRNNSEDEFHLLIVDREDEKIQINSHRVKTHYVEALAISGFEKLAFIYDIVELNTAVKPTFIKHLFRQYNASSVTYLDPDTYLFSNPRNISNQHDVSSIILSPHALTPHDLGEVPGERMYLKIGTFNLGFVSVRNDENTRAFLNWWEPRCLRSCFSEPYTGLFVDQKWCNLVPTLFDGVLASRHFGLNMANWNLHERRITRVGDMLMVNNKDPLIFFHFSGYQIKMPDVISRHTPDLTLANRPDLKDVYQQYEIELRNQLVIFGRALPPYSYGAYTNGVVINDLSRKLFLGSPWWSSASSPFDASGEFFKWLTSKGLDLAKPLAEAKATAKSVPRSDRRLKALHIVLRAASRLLGASRYSAILRYLSYVGMPRNQGYVFFEEHNNSRPSIEVQIP